MRRAVPDGRRSVARGWTARTGTLGLSLIELLIALVVLAILATVAIPAYERMTQSVRRSDARAAAHAVALAEQRFFTANGRYTDVSAASIFPDPASPLLKPCATGNCSEKEYYAWVVTTPNDGLAFTVTVTPVAGKSQANDIYCTSLTLSSRGIQGGTKDANASEMKCW
jgi:type IV pilus assembly protein PilE